MIIAIDGTSGSGKSTLAKRLAKTLGFGFFSAGAFYRAITFKALERGISPENDDALKLMLASTHISCKFDGEQNQMVVDGNNITAFLHDERISENVAKYAAKGFVREFVKALQKDTPNHNTNIVMEGRDIGSVIFPDADFKVYVDCSAEERARRRFADISKTDTSLTFEKVLADLKERDFLDTTREISPLVMCQDAYLLDTTSKPVDTCIETLVSQMKNRNLL